MAEFCDADFEIILGDEQHERVYRLEDLLPMSFGAEDITNDDV